MGEELDGWAPSLVKMRRLALVAQRIRASDYGSEGREFESLQARWQSRSEMGGFFVGSRQDTDGQPPRCLRSGHVLRFHDRLD